MFLEKPWQRVIYGINDWLSNKGTVQSVINSVSGTPSCQNLPQRTQWVFLQQAPDMNVAF